MARVVFTANLERHLSCPETTVSGDSVREALDSVFETHQQLRGYVLDDQNRLRQHMVIFVDGAMIVDRIHLSDVITEKSEIYVMQALSGG
ncbi:MAG: MoaD/ThiS family protein [Planctomycetes bacterium]|nr:MoaD/ThiS family protein [Planctomycetota bacterium]MCH9725049.1 MoaD/ThiS family protein [Planctomycetota bacterium]MCH9779335.1 MoaD/ThiS family protein [Planctomycetota bacterium]MCH9789871.1 MoaD/ThiS family protein [Planctomycetota bacterium]